MVAEPPSNPPNWPSLSKSQQKTQHGAPHSLQRRVWAGLVLEASQVALVPGALEKGGDMGTSYSQPHPAPAPAC